MKGLDRYVKANASRLLNDMDFHDLMGMLGEGMTEGEIARELGVSDKVIEWIRREAEKDV